MPLDDGKDTLVFRDIRTFGRVWAGTTTKLESLRSLAKLGPEPLTIDAETFYARLLQKRGRLKALLLIQEFLAGVGNIYADESLYAAQLHPLTLSARVKRERADVLLASIQKILAAAIKAGGSSIDDFLHPDGEPGWFQRELMAYGREGEPCRRCGTAIKRIVLGQRGTWFCPKCQKR
jgi:formamidopyrimidine-DNA glycosylase